MTVRHEMQSAPNGNPGRKPHNKDGKRSTDHAAKYPRSTCSHDLGAQLIWVKICEQDKRQSGEWPVLNADKQDRHDINAKVQANCCTQRACARG